VERTPRRQPVSRVPLEPEAIVQGLLRPDAFPHPADNLELKETHGAWVVLAGPWAYKLKKPVNLGFFDFSTTEKRAADAEAEVRLNRRLAPSIYLGTVDVVLRDGKIYVGGPGQVLERAVWMRRLPADGMLTELLRHHAATPDLMRRIARLVADFHAVAPTGPGVDEHGSLATIEANWRENFEQIEPHVESTISARDLAAIQRYATNFLRNERLLLERRIEEGRIRDGHGDLHAGSICVMDEEIVIFDCIQFAARYRCADVAAEVAFLAMDLDHAERADLGREFVGEYVQRSGDFKLPKLLDFYSCYRAFVRGKVLSLLLGTGEPRNGNREALASQARSYFALAKGYAS
jgi:uncharacterized protein